MKARVSRNYQILTGILVIGMVACFYFQYMTISAYNSELHVSSDSTPGEDCSAVIVPRGDDTSSWYKQDTGLTGQIFDATVTNGTSDLVSSWTMRIDIVDSCYLNQFWNGLVEIHQHVSEGKEIVQSLKLADYDPSTLEIDYRMDGSDLLIPLESGDYLVYHPSEEFSEMPLSSAAQTVVGFIMYYDDEIEVADYQISYYCHRDFTEGVAFVLFVIMGAILAFLLITHFIVLHAYRQAENELELRKSGLSCMSEIYAVIYLIDLVANTIVPVGISEEADRSRPKNLSPNDQLGHLIHSDALPAYQEIALEFVDLDTIHERMEGRNSIVIEYESQKYGWCRIRFIAMDRSEHDVLEKVLFTIEQTSEEKRELRAILNEAMRAKVEAEEQEALLESMSLELKESFDAFDKISENILSESSEEAMLDHANKMYGAKATMRWLMDNATDYARTKAGKAAVTSTTYLLKDLVLDAQHLAHPILSNMELDFETEVAQSLPRKLCGDVEKLRQTIANLLISAATAEGATGVKLSIFGKAVDKGTLHMLVSVTTTQETGTKQDLQTTLPAKDGHKSNDEENGIVINAVNATLLLMGSRLSVTDTYGGGKNLYFEIDQQIIDEKPVGPLGESDADRGAH